MPFEWFRNPVEKIVNENSPFTIGLKSLESI